jgi:hypothetical protein
MQVRGRDQANTNPPEVNPRNKRRQRRLQILKEIRDKHASVRVVPVEKYRPVLVHPTAGGFREKGGATWQNARFTQRRMRDGDIKIEQKKTDEKPEAKPQASRSASNTESTQATSTQQD